MTEVYLGEPPAHIKNWIITHSKPATRPETVIHYTAASGLEEKIINIEGELTPQLQIPDLRYIESVEIGLNVTSIDFGAFWDCSSLTSVTIPDSVTSIGDSAFYGCSGLTSITIGNSVTLIDTAAFYMCSGLTSIMIPNSVTSIGIYAFGECSNLTTVYVPLETSSERINDVRRMMTDADAPSTIEIVEQ